MAISAYGATKTIGGTAGCLDDILHTSIGDGDLAIVVDGINDIAYHYTYNSSSATAESDPDVVKPDSNSGNGRWILVATKVASITLGTGTEISELSIDGTLAGDSDDALPTEKAVKAYVDSHNYLHTETPAAASWTVTHNLGVLYPIVEVIVGGKSVAGTYDEPEITYDSTSQLTVAFAASTEGFVNCIGGY